MDLTIDDLNKVPEFRALLTLVEQQGQELKNLRDLRDQLPEWVDEQEAQRLTGLPFGTLWRERKNPKSLIVWRQNRGVCRYLRASLIDHNNSRIVGEE